MAWADEMGKLTSRPIVLLEIAFSSGTEYYSTVTVRFPSRPYAGKIVRMSSLRRAMQKNLGIFESASMEFWLADTDASFANTLASEVTKGVVATVKVGTDGLDVGDFETIFKGKIDDFGVDNFQFRILIKDPLWTMPDKPDVGTVNETDFPNALPSELGKPLPICYGEHSFTEADIPATTDQKDFTLRGAWPCIYIDVRDTERTFLVARHAVKDINEVYAYKPSAGSQLLTLTTDYTVDKAATINSETMAIIQLTATGFAKLVDTNVLGVITCNVEGKEDVGDGTGDLISNPIDVIEDLFDNYGGGPDKNTSLFTAARSIAADRSYLVSGGYVVEKTFDEVIRDICNSFQIRVFPDKNGAIGISIYDPTSVLATGLKLREQWEILNGTYRVDFTSDVQGAEDANIINKVEYKFNRHVAKDVFNGSGEQSDASSIADYGEKTLVISLPWASDESTASDIASRILTLYKNPVAHIEVQTPLLGMNMELADAVAVTHADGPDGGYADHPFEVIEHTYDPNDHTCRIRGKDVSAIVGDAFFLDDETLRARATSGTASVTNTSDEIMITNPAAAGVVVGDIIRLKTVTHEANLGCHKITGVNSGSVTVANTTWVTELGIVFDIIPSWVTKIGVQTLAGHLCDRASGQFSNGDAGKQLQ